MIYPRDPMLTLGEFIDKVKREFGGGLVEGEITGSRGKTPLRTLYRTDGTGEVRYTILPNIEDGYRLTLNTMHDLLGNLGLDNYHRDFGLVLMM